MEQQSLTFYMINNHKLGYFLLENFEFFVRFLDIASKDSFPSEEAFSTTSVESSNAASNSIYK